ncbi:lipopolysaccharide biosynthesis protein [Paenibacillus antri]|uniref:Lipopolysaccharide biosynthesis protein n=1 Tax=Paenibacillus antri TaxID=2582848 RepID=A0A5R9G0S7_9BACL|nr:Wzz/FepE/Etk N-terminal domain-containing protein [Paenibacillus antri]TLS49381.1 lipopolysaccharide biosynthesis protein [Paenibacillus antri]
MRSDEIDVRVYFTMIKRRLWLIVVCVASFTTLAAWYSYQNYVPLYEAHTKLIVNDASEADPFGRQLMNIGGGGANSGLIDTYKEVIRTPIIMDKVVQRYPNLGVSSEYLMSAVRVAALNNTQVMIFSIVDYSHERAVSIVNAITDVFQAEIPHISPVNSVVVLTEAKMESDPQPINEKQNTYIVLGFMASLILSVGAVILLDSLDDTLRTEDDIREALGIPTLSSIPKLEKRRRSKAKNVGEGSYAAVKS